MRVPKFKYMFQNRALVLMYHRINTPVSDPWNLSVSPENFEQHLKVLKNNYSVVSTDELIRQLETKKIKNRSIALTFDDGYLDNFTTAKPLLEKHSLPATFFITDSYLGNQSFWWDELEHIIVHTDQLPATFSISFKGDTIQFELGNETALNDDLRAKQINYNASKPPTLRTKLYLKLWKIFSSLLKEEQMHLLQLIRNWADLSENETKVGGCMSAQQLIQLEHNPLFTIGGHTKTHPSLSNHSKEVQAKEILENKQFLETYLNKKMNHFAYPSGNYNSETLQILKNSDYAAAFTTLPDHITKKSDVLRIGRFQVMNFGKKNIEKALIKWFRE